MTVTVKMLVDKLKLKVVYGNEELLAPHSHRQP